MLVILAGKSVRTRGEHLESVHPPWFPHFLTKFDSEFSALSIDRVEISDRIGQKGYYHEAAVPEGPMPLAKS